VSKRAQIQRRFEEDVFINVHRLIYKVFVIIIRLYSILIFL